MKRLPPFADVVEQLVYMDPMCGCWLWLGIIKGNGYGEYAYRSVHRLMWEKVNGEIPADMCVCHKCDVRICINPDHLFLGTRRENNLDMRRKNRQAILPNTKGEAHAKAKLTEADILAIRSRYKRGVHGHGMRRIAKDYNVNTRTIYDVITRKHWSHI